MSSSDAPSAAVRTMIPPSLDVELLEDVLQAGALVVVEPARDAEPFALRDEDDEAAGERDLRRQPGALRLHRVLDRLDEDRLAAADQVLDLAAVAASRAPGRRSRRRRGSRSSRGRSRRTRPPCRAARCRPGLVDVPRDRALLGPLEVDLGDAVVLEDGDALLADVDGDEELALRGRQRRAARRLAARRVATGAAALLPLRELASVAAASPASARASSAGARRGVASPAAAAVPGFFRPRPPRLPRRRLGRSDRSVRRRPAAAAGSTVAARASLELSQGTVGRRKILLPASEPGQAKTPSWERATATRLFRVRACSLSVSMKKLGMASSPG